MLVEFRYSPDQDTMEDGVFLILIISNENTIDIPGILGKNLCQHILLSFQV